MVSFEDFPPLGRTCSDVSTDVYNGPRCTGYFQFIGFGTPPHLRCLRWIRGLITLLTKVSDHVLVLVGVSRYGRFGKQSIEVNTQHMDTLEMS